MLFNSFSFILFFLPVTLLGFYFIGKRYNHRLGIYWLVGASLFFYGWWNPVYLCLLLTSILLNYAVGVLLGAKPSKPILFLGISGNLGLIGYFKYANFFIDNINVVFQSDIILRQIVLPLGISFFIFQQISFLIDTYRGETKRLNLLHYSLFVSFFPKLIAGPIVQCKEMLPQFVRNTLHKNISEYFAIGLTFFFIGLFKKAIIADGIAIHATPVFNAAEQGIALTFFEAWGGALAYSLQLYFDFSGYSEMAFGIASMFGIVLPINFDSPYKAVNIADFWRRWHMTLSRFLKNYLYIPLGGNKKGTTRHYLNLMITMLIGGLWHGAGWSFVLWGGLHGVYLCISHMWGRMKKKIFKTKNQPSNRYSRTAGRLLTFFAVAIAWVLFRSESIEGARNMYHGMLGMNGFSLPTQLDFMIDALRSFFPDTYIVAHGLRSFGYVRGVFKLFLLLIIVWIMPNTYDLMKSGGTSLNLELLNYRTSLIIHWKEWHPSTTWAFTIGMIALLSLLSLTHVSEFLYFQF